MKLTRDINAQHQKIVKMPVPTKFVNNIYKLHDHVVNICFIIVNYIICARSTVDRNTVKNAYTTKSLCYNKNKKNIVCYLPIRFEVRKNFYFQIICTIYL